MKSKVKDPTIRNLKLGRVLRQLRPLARENGWNSRDLAELRELYLQFLFLCKKFPARKIIPTWEIDQFWHQHILNTRQYSEDCSRIFGYYLHHTPGREVGASGVDDIDQYFAKTLALVSKEFGDERGQR